MSQWLYCNRFIMLQSSSVSYISSRRPTWVAPFLSHWMCTQIHQFHLIPLWVERARHSTAAEEVFISDSSTVGLWLSSVWQMTVLMICIYNLICWLDSLCYGLWVRRAYKWIWVAPIIQFISLKGISRALLSGRQQLERRYFSYKHSDIAQVLL